jgi:hypothetical protein
MLHTLTLAIVPALRSDIGADALTIAYQSDRPQADPRDGNARAKAAGALCAALTATVPGRELLREAEGGALPAIHALFLALPACWRDAAAAWEAYAQWIAGTGPRPDAQPDWRSTARRALAAHAKAPAPVEPAATVEAAPTDTPAPAAPRKRTRKAKSAARQGWEESKADASPAVD